MRRVDEGKSVQEIKQSKEFAGTKRPSIQVLELLTDEDAIRRER